MTTRRVDILLLPQAEVPDFAGPRGTFTPASRTARRMDAAWTAAPH